MYGFIHCCLEDLVLQFFGEEKWKEILESSNLQLDGGSSFLIHRIYTDEETLQLVGATCQVLGLDLDSCLETFGEHFLHYCQGAGFDRLLRVLGGNLEDFLTSLDFLHEHLASIYPGMHAPSFRCTHGENGDLMLHYYSDRKGLQSIVKGLVKIVSREFFGTDVTIEDSDSVGDHIILRVSTDEIKAEANVLPKLIRESGGSQNPNDLLMNVSTFCRAFPFHVVFNSEFTITQVGTSLRHLLRHVWSSGERDFRRLFKFTRPVVDSTFTAIFDHQNATFVAQTLPGILKPEDETALLKLKGQMMPCPESSSMLFLCSPRVSGPDEMQTQGIYLSDFRVHDFTRELVLVRNAHRGERELMQRLEETTNQLKIADAQLLADKKRTEELLHSILPSKVAARLALNLPVPAEVFDVVTVLFSDIVGFTAMCSDERVKPIDIVQVLDKMYTLFDMLSGHYKLYKVETIGDAYMVVGGIPEFVPTHADRVVAMGLGMVEVIKKVLSPIDKQPLKMRVGVHTGSVLAGVVGQQMPRYCLFGNTVTLGNKMESNGLPGRVNVSQQTINNLTSKTSYTFEEHPVPKFALKCFLVIPPSDCEIVEADLLAKMNASVSAISARAEAERSELTTTLTKPLDKDNLQANIPDKGPRHKNETMRYVVFHPDMDPLAIPLVCPIPHYSSGRISQDAKKVSSAPGVDTTEELASAAKTSAAEIPVAVIHPASNTEEIKSDRSPNPRAVVPDERSSPFLPRMATYPPTSNSDQATNVNPDHPNPKILATSRGILPFLGLAFCSHYRRPNNNTNTTTEWLERIARKREEAARKLSQAQASKMAAASTKVIDVKTAAADEVDNGRKEEASPGLSKSNSEREVDEGCAAAAAVPVTRSGFLCKSRSFVDGSTGFSKTTVSSVNKNDGEPRKSAEEDRKDERRTSAKSGRESAVSDPVVNNGNEDDPPVARNSVRKVPSKP